jgi:hypothetical protein
MSLKENIFTLREKGYSYSQISNELGCSKGTISYHVGEGQKHKTNENRKNNRRKIQQYLIEYKENIGCIDCKEKYPHYMLEFDHLPDYKKIGSVAYLAKSKGFNVVIFPKHIKQKDLNDMILFGMNKNELKTLVDSRIYSGIRAKFELDISRS